MPGLIAIVAAVGLEALSDLNPALLLTVAVGLLVMCGVLFALLLLSRRRFVRDIREVVRALEELRLGRTRLRSESDSGSPLALVFDAVNRLGQDVAARVRTADHQDERVRALMAAMGDSAIVTTDLDGEIRSFNQGARVLFGWDEEQVMSRPVAMLFDESSYKEFLPKLARRSLRESGVSEGAHLLRRDGSGFEADVSVRLLHGSSGDPSGFLLVARDVTRQLELEAQLRESEQRYRNLVEGLAEGVLIVRGGRVVYANPALGTLFGVESTSLVDSSLRDRVATRDVLLVEETLSSLEHQPRGKAELPCRLIEADGSEREVLLNASTIRFDGRPAVLLLVRDDSLERRFVAELQRNEKQLDAVVEATSDGILVLVDGRNGRVVQMTNRAFVERFGLEQEQILGSNEHELLHLLGQRSYPAAAVAEYLSSSLDEDDGGAMPVAGKKYGDLELTVRPLQDREGQTVGKVLACRDLTRQRESERKLQLHAEELQLSKLMLQRAYRKLDHANKDLQRRSEQLDGVNRELRTLNEMKSNLLGNVSHELQTPLVSIRGYTEMILKGRLGQITDEQRKGLALCLKNIDRLISMIDNLLVFSRSELEQAQLKLERFGLSQIVDDTLKLLEDKVGAKNLEIETRIEPADLALYADRDKIQQVFINLVANAIKFNRSGGSISVRAAPGKPGFAAVTVEDTGVGIPASELDRIFERHYQVARDPSHSPRGSGIGLAIVQDILRSHGCVISVDSEEGRGARFYFTLPLQVDQARNDADAVEAAETDPEPPASSVDPPGIPSGDPDPAGPRLRIIRHRDG